MKKKVTKTSDQQLSLLAKKWDKIWSNLNEVNIYFQSYVDTVLLVHQRIKMEPLIKSFEGLKDNCQKFYDTLDDVQSSSKVVAAIQVALPWESDKFKEEWQGWKDYLKEQHQIVLSSRAESKQLETLKTITGGNENEAYAILNYAMSNLYKMFFKLDEKPTKKNNKPNSRKRDEDF